MKIETSRTSSYCLRFREYLSLDHKWGSPLPPKRPDNEKIAATGDTRNMQRNRIDPARKIAVEDDGSLTSCHIENFPGRSTAVPKFNCNCCIVRDDRRANLM